MCIFACAKMVCLQASAVRTNHVIAAQGQVSNLPSTRPCHTKGETGNRGQGAFETRPYATPFSSLRA
jgi:hypothetical protein